jgi:hypothetical protein
MRPAITHAEILALLDYDPATGVFTWLPRPGAKAWNTRYAGKVAGSNWRAGPNVVYRVLRIHDWPFSAHRVAVFWMTGEWPPHGVDHRDLNGLNNRWLNLRPATKAQNGANTGAPRTNTSGFKGVSFAHGRWRATIRVGGRQKWLGYHDTPEAAHAAYVAAANERSGEFARAS